MTTRLTGISNGGRKHVSLAMNGGAHPGSIGPPGNLRARLASRSRVTNLGVVFLLAFSTFSGLLNLKHWLFPPRLPIPPPGFDTWETFHGLTPEGLSRLQPDPAPGAESLTHMVLVVGHAIWAGCAFEGKESDDNWILESYQRGGSIKTYWKHIEKGIQIANADVESLLVFSGGQTRPQSLMTEAESYYSLALSSGLNLPILPGANASTKALGKDGARLINIVDEDRDGSGREVDVPAVQPDVNHIGTGAHSNAGVGTTLHFDGLQAIRMTTENFALDSLQNLLFSIARFREYTGSYPERITVVGYAIKKARFEELHAKAVRWPVKSSVRGHKRFIYVGIDDEGDITSEYEGERVKGYHLFERDMYGCYGKLLKKRLERNPTRRFHPYFSSAPEMADLLNWCPGENFGLRGIYAETLPWDVRSTSGGMSKKVQRLVKAKKGWFPDIRWVQVGRERR